MFDNEDVQPPTYSRFSVIAWNGPAAAQHTYSKAVQKACANDYKTHCGQYGIETDALRLRPVIDVAARGLMSRVPGRKSCDASRLVKHLAGSKTATRL